MSDELVGVRVASFESRRNSDMQRLLEKRGAQVLNAPSMQEVPLEDQRAALAFAERLQARAYDALILLSGGGTRKLIDAAAKRIELQQLRQLLSSVPLLCRGPKPVSVLREHGLKPTLVAPEPNTSEDLLTAIDAQLDLRGKCVAVQEYGQSNTDLLEELRQRGAEVEPVLVYAWQLPEDTGPLERAVRELSAGNVDAAIFTSARQVDHLLHVAGVLSLEQDVITALNQVVVASVGPVTSASLQRSGIHVTTEPEHPKMGTLVAHLAKNWPRLKAQSS